MKKFLAVKSYNMLGTKHDTREEAELALRTENAMLDSQTGYCSTFHEFSNIDAGHVIEYDDEQVITKEEYDKSREEYMYAKELLRAEIDKLREERLGKFWRIEYIYHNQVAYQSEDLLRVTLRSVSSGRRKVVDGKVVDSVACDNGEIWPCMKKLEMSASHTIEKIEVVGNARSLPNEHCTHYHYSSKGPCSHYDKINNKCLLLEKAIKKEQV